MDSSIVLLVCPHGIWLPPDRARRRKPQSPVSYSETSYTVIFAKFYLLKWRQFKFSLIFKEKRIRHHLSKWGVICGHIASTAIVRDVTIVIEERACRYSSILSGKTAADQVLSTLVLRHAAQSCLFPSIFCCFMFVYCFTRGFKAWKVLPSSIWCAVVSFQT